MERAHLGGADGGVDEAHAIFTDVLSVQSTCEELVVRTVDGVTALERHNVCVGGEHATHLLRGGAGEHTLG